MNYNKQIAILILSFFSIFVLLVIYSTTYIEIHGYQYYNIDKWSKNSIYKPMIITAMEDGKISKSEYNEISELEKIDTKTKYKQSIRINCGN